MDPVSQIFAQAAAPTGKWDGATQAFLEGRRMRQQQQQMQQQQSQFDSRLALEKDELTSRNAMQKLHAESTRLINTERGLDIQLKLLQKQRDLQILDAETQGAQIMLDAPDYELGAADPEIRARTSKLIKGVPGFAGTPTGKALLANSLAAINWYNGERHAEANGMLPLRETVPTPSGGATTFGLPDKTTTAGPSTELERAMANAGMTPEEIIAANKALVAMKTTPRGEDVTITTPDGHTMTYSRGGRAGTGGPVSTAGQTAAVDKITKDENALSDLADAQAALRDNPRAVGPVGKIATALDFVASTIDPTRKPSSIVDARLKLQETANTLIPAFKADSQMSNYERKKLEQVTDFTGWADTTPRAMEALGDLQDILVARALRERRNKLSGQPVSPRLLDSIRNEQEALALNREGLLSKDDALGWYERRKAIK